MKHHKANLIGAILSLIICIPPYAKGDDAEGPDWRNYDALLKTHVAKGVKHGISLALVDYAALGNDPDLQRTLNLIANYPRDRLNDRNQRLAFFINAYNVLALKMVADRWPVDSIKDIGTLFHSVWNKKAGIVMGREMTLDEIENDVLRAMGDPRIHFTIVCASVSCPDLRAEAYRADRLPAQFDDQIWAFLTNSGKGLQWAGNSLILSPIFDWFEEDFDRTGGVIRFIQGYRNDIPDNARIRYFDYDWSVNARRR